MPVEHLKSSRYFLFCFRGDCGLSPAERYDGHRVFIVENEESELDKKTNSWKDGGKHEEMFDDYIPGDKSGNTWFRSMGTSGIDASLSTPMIEKLVNIGSNKYALNVRTEYINPGWVNEKNGKTKKWCAPILRVEVLATQGRKYLNSGISKPCKRNMYYKMHVVT